MVSILKDEENEHYSYDFPIKRPLKIRLKDVLEENVDEKYYLSAKALSGVINTTFQSSKLESRTEDENGVIPTPCARDYKDPKLVQVAQLDGYESIGFTITTNESQMPFVAELRTDEGIRTFKDGLVGTLRTTESCGDKIVIEEATTKDYAEASDGDTRKGIVIEIDKKAYIQIENKRYRIRKVTPLRMLATYGH